MPLGPELTTAKVLLSTTSRLVGEYKSNGLLLTHAWPDFGDGERIARGMSENQLCRNFIVASFTTPPPVESDRMYLMPDSLGFGRKICTSLSVLYGKRFDCHGCLESSGRFHAPSNPDTAPIPNPGHPIHSHVPRVTLGIPLNLEEFGRLAPVLSWSPQPESNRGPVFHASARFYWQALQEFDADPERAFLDLITCGEILAEQSPGEPADYLDSQTLKDLDAVERGLPNGREIRRRLSGRLRQVKRRFVRTLADLLNDHFFEDSDSCQPSNRLTRANIETSLEAAYDVRSNYIHRGSSFGVTIRGLPTCDEVGGVYSTAYEESWVRLLMKSATFAGLERVIRFGLLGILHRSGVPIDDRLAADRAAPPDSPGQIRDKSGQIRDASQLGGRESG